MPKWSDLKNMASRANGARKIAGKAKGIHDDIKNDGMISAAKKYAGKKARQKARKAAGKAAMTFLRFLATPPWGWVTAAAIILIGFPLISSLGNQMSGIDNTSGQNEVTQEEYAALQASCNVSGNNDNGGVNALNFNASGLPSDPSGKTHGYSLQQVVKFSSSPYSSTWGITPEKAAAFFLNRNSAVATEFGLNSGNISKVTQAIEQAGVSPVFFYLYSVNENGGFGGFINHYSVADSPTDGVAAARQDAEYIVQKSHQVGGVVATGGGLPSDCPTADAQKIFESLPAGSMGRAYYPATAATTGEIESLLGKYDMSTIGIGWPLSNMMSYVQQLGGNVNDASQMSVTSADVSNTNCSNTGDNSSLASGGMNLDQATQFMTTFNNLSLNVSTDAPGAAEGTPKPQDNCVVFTNWFVHKYTDLKTASSNGGQVVATMAAENQGLKQSTDNPTPYAVFSIDKDGGGPGLAYGEAGHTGIVLGIDKDKGIAYIGEAEFQHSFTTINDPNSGVNAIPWKLSDMNAANGWHFLDISSHLKGIGGK